MIHFSGTLVMLTLLVFSDVPGVDAQKDAQTVSARKELESWYSAIAESGTPGFAVLVQQNGKPIFAKGYGLRDLRNHQPIDEHTNFRLASCTKQFTAMAIMLLVHDGKLRYEESLTDIFPEFSAYGKTVTVRNLLNHTSGLPDYEDLMSAVEKEKGSLWSPENQIRDSEVMQLLEEGHGKFTPGTKWEYSNSGYVILGLIVAKRSGKSFGNFLQERIFAPLQMNHTLVFEKGKNKIANRAYGHSRRDGKLVETDQSSTSATQGDGDIYSNLEDLGKWDDALRNHTLLSQKEFATAITPVVLPLSAEQKLAEDAPESLRAKALGYGFGWFLDLNSPHPLMWHYGDTMGFKTAILRYLDSKLTVIVLGNRTDLDVGALALKTANVIAKSH
ncbi:MAG TPA: serine hydrolase domain-containing protein [Candidatus Acidoferrum sp.]|nr:serine hydrolase domain-containing protein [Candidatus Acidoferrum sp.]